MLTYILIGFIILLALILIYVAFRPAGMFISRELLIQASPEELFPHINNIKKTDVWMPWREVDSKMTSSYFGPEEGVGATSSWVSTGQMGVGQAIVVESVANQFVKTQLTYTKPMQMKQLAEVSLHPTSNGTIVRWSVQGESAFVMRFFCLFINMDKIVGANFEKGLSNLNSLFVK